MTGPTVSVVVNTLNRARHLRGALEGLRAQRYRDFEVVVVNGPSTDGTAELLASEAGSIKVRHCPVASLGTSRNLGIAAASGEIVAFLDDDAVPEPAWLERLVRPYADPSVGVVGGGILDHTGVAWQAKLTVCDRFGRATHPERLPDEVGSAVSGSPRFPAPTGANASFRRRALVEVGGFDETIAWFLDETDTCLRVLDAGWTVRLVEGAIVHHKYAPSHIRTADKLPRNLYQPVLSVAYFAMRHGRPVHGHEAALRRVFSEVASRLTDIDFLSLSRALPKKDVQRLRKEIRDGARDGMRLGLTSPPATRGDLGPPSLPLLRFPRRIPEGGRLRVVLVSQDYPPGKVGGIGIWTHNLARSLAKAGHEVSVVCRGGAHTVDFEDGVWVHRIVPRRRPVGAMGDVPRPMADHCNSVAAEVASIADLRGVDVVSAPIWDLEGEALRREGRFPVVTSLHTTYRMSLPSKPEWTRHEEYFRGHVEPIIAAEDRIVREGLALLANSEAIVRDVFAGASSIPDADRIALVPHGLDDAAGDPVDVIGDGSVRVLYVGRLERRKGIDTLVAAAEIFLPGRPHARLSVVGDETNDFERPWRDVVAEAARQRPDMGRIEMPGFVSPTELTRRYASCDVFVAPSRYESFGLIYLEAMRFGKPCVGTFAGGVPEVIEDGVTGILVPPGDPDALAAAVARLVDDEGLRREMGRRGRERFEAAFSSSAMADAAASAYRRFTTGAKGR